MSKYICGSCGLGFDEAQDELNHDCEVLGCKPTDPQSMGAGWEKISENALKRGEERKSEAPIAKKVVK